MKKVTNGDKKANISIVFVGRLLELPAGVEDTFQDDQADFLKVRYPWVSVSNVSDEDEDKDEDAPTVKWTKTKLLEYAEDNEIEVSEDLNKKQILEAIEEDSEEVDEDSEAGDDDESSEEDKDSE